jgi:hypothetical protein
MIEIKKVPIILLLLFTVFFMYDTRRTYEYTRG